MGEKDLISDDRSLYNMPKRPPSVPFYGTSPSSQSKGCRKQWPATKDLLDDYLNKKSETRRRSSCKEITLHLLRNDSKQPGDHTKPKFKVIEEERSLTIENTFLGTFEEAKQSKEAPCYTYCNITNTLSAISELIEKHPIRLRSTSTDGYNAIDNKVRLNESKAFIFDSVPDLQDAIQKESFAEARKQRRHGQMYSLNESHKLLEKLSLNGKEDKH